MKRFNTIMLLGLLSISSSANVQAVGEGVGGATLRCEGNINLPETPKQEEIKLDGKFYAIPNPEIYEFGYFDARRSAKYISFVDTDKNDALVIEFKTNKDSVAKDGINQDNITDALAITNALNQISKNDTLVLCKEFKTEGFTNFTAEEKNQIATVYACWLIKFKDMGAKAAIGETNKKMTDVKVNEGIVKSYFSHLTLTPTKSWSKINIATAVFGVLLIAEIAALTLAPQHPPIY